MEIEKFCDGVWDDCGNDEVSCSSNNKTACSSINCSYNCKITPNGPKCYCPKGQEPNGTKCVDVDECRSQTFNTCDQKCDNTWGSFKCSCVEGYRLDGDRCRAIDVPPGSKPVLQFLTQTDVRRVYITNDINSSNKKNSSNNNSNSSNVKIASSETVMMVNYAIALEMWHKNESICIITADANETVEFNCHDFLKPENKRRMPSPNLFSLDSVSRLCLDWISGNWYFYDFEREIIFVCTSEMQHCTIILEHNLEKPRGMALDPTKGYIFYAVWGKSPATIERANLDGTNIKQIVNEKIVYPHAVSVDLAMSHIYYIDSYLDNVERVNYDGSNRWSMKKKSQLLGIAQSLHSITVFEDTIYLASWNNQSIIAVNKKTSDARIVHRDVTRPFSLHVYHRQRQPDVKHPCQDANRGGCQHLCVPLYEKGVPVARCLCSPGFKLEKKSGKCLRNDEPVFLLYAKESSMMIKGISIAEEHYTKNAIPETIIPITNLTWPVSFDYNVKDKLIYFGNTVEILRKSRTFARTFNIESQTLDGDDRKVLVEGLKTISGLAYDWLGNNLFYTNSDANTVSVIKLANTDIRKTLIRNTYHPMAITLDPKRGKMYWSTWASLQQSTGLIESAYLDGRNRAVFVNASIRHLHWPTSLSIDFEEEMLYWCDPVTPGIERIKLDGTGRQLLYEGAQNQFYPMSAVYHDKFIYWTDNVKGGIMKLSIEDALRDPSAETYVTLIDEKPLVYDMKIYNNKLKLEASTCDTEKCQGICLQTPEGQKCVCGDGFNEELNGDRILCHKIENYTDVQKCPSNIFIDTFKCKSSETCIDMEFVCDGVPHCADESDESADADGPCSGTCDLKFNFKCDGNRCIKKEMLCDDGKKCSLEHACDNWGTCSQMCLPNGKRYKCGCSEGYTLQFDGFSCKSNNKDSPYVIFSNRQEIRGVDLKTLAVKNFYTSLRNTIALDYLYTNSSIYVVWTDVIDDKIYKGTLISDSISNVEAVVQSGLSTAEGLAVDWIGYNLYWVDSNLDQIEVAKFNGSFRRTLIAGDMESPRAISLDPRDGLLFWTDWDEGNPRVERCSMAGEFRTIIMEVDRVNGAWPNGLTLDYTTRRVYWIDARSDSIHSTNYDGKDHHLIISDQETLSHPFGISLYENHVYWTDWRTMSVIRANKWNGSDIAVIQRTQTQPFGIQILHSSRQPVDGPNPCGKNNGQCSHLCLLSINKTYKCECPHVMRLSDDTKTCIPNEQILLFSMASEIRGVDLYRPNHNTIPTISHPTQVVSTFLIDYIVSEEKIYWVDNSLNELKSSGLASGPIATILDTSIEHITAFCVDWISKLIFIAVNKPDSRIYAYNTNGEYLTEIYRSNMIVRSMTVDPVVGHLYYSVSDDTSETNEIYYCDLDGSNHFPLVNRSSESSLGGSYLSLQFIRPSERLYFLNHKGIWFVDIRDGKPQMIYSSRYHQEIAAITVYESHIYFVDNLDNSIQRCTITDCKSATVIRNSTNQLTDIKMYYPASQKGSNKCEKERGGCQHLCFPKLDSHVCKCAIGFEPADEKSITCKGVEEFLIYSMGHELRGIGLDSSMENSDEAKSVLGPLQQISLATNIDYHYDTDHIYWADSDKGTVTRIKRDGTGREVIVNQYEAMDSSSGDWLGGIAIDWIAGNLYWTDQKRNLIEVMRLDEKIRYVVVSNIDQPRVITVDPIAGLLFYAGHGKIGRTSLDGTELLIIANQSSTVNSITLDPLNQHVYWCEMSSDIIMRMDYDGNNKQTILNTTIDNPVALDLIDGNLYWADTTHDSAIIKMAPLDNISDSITITTVKSSIKDLKIFSKKKQGARGTGSNLCAVNNGGCQELCLYNGTSAVCVCSHGRIAPDGKSCEDYTTFLIFSRVNSIESVHVTDFKNMNGPIAKIQNATFLKNTIALAYDYRRSVLYYSDIHWGTINSVYFNGSGHTQIVNKQVTVEGLAFDPVSTTLFWTSNNDASIRSLDIRILENNITLNTEKVKQIISLKSQDKLRGIAVESCLAMVYWTNWNSHAPAIQRAYISGYGTEMQDSAQNCTANPCQVLNGGCEDVCTADRDGKIKCHCTQGTLADDGKRCRPKILTHCAIGQFECSNGGCDDCLDATPGQLSSDEQNCTKHCKTNQFKCENTSVCIPSGWQCDGNPDCEDGSDEGPQCASRECNTSQFLCKSTGRCIPYTWVCDGEICVEKKGTHFNCKCVSGYGKGHGKNDTCTALDSEQKLLFAGENGLQYMSPNRNHEGSYHVKLFNSMSVKIKTFDYLIKSSGETIVIWIDYTTKRIQKVTLKSMIWKTEESKRSKRANIEQDILTIVEDLENPISLAIDYLSEKLYVMDASSEAIIVMDLDGKKRTTIVYTGRYPTEIILDLENRNLIWSTKLKAIMFASMDGSNKKALVSHDIEWASGLTIDYPTGRLFWVDQRKSTIESSALNGSDIHYVQQLDDLAKPQKIDVFEDYLYVTLQNQSIIKLNKYGNGPIEHVLDSNHRAYSLAMVHQLKQYLEASNPCTTNTCDSSAICLLSSANGSRRTCTCPDTLHKTVRDGKVVCEEKSSIPDSCNLKCVQGTCRFVDGRPKCFCHPKYDGELCDHFICSGHCQNQGKCYILFKSNNQTELKCICMPGFSGAQCEIPVDLCKSVCHNGGTCIYSSHGIEKCICPSGFTGEKCEDCADLQCFNEGVCRKNENDASVCSCPDGYYGKQCRSNHCDNFCINGECKWNGIEAKCDCRRFFWGKRCETHCSKYCENGQCETKYLPFQEHCQDYMTNTGCGNYECRNGGTCVDIKGTPYCNCTREYNGEFCETFVGYGHACINYCQNDGICRLDNARRAKCTCIGQWEGEKCDKPPKCAGECGRCEKETINECLCDNGTIANCINAPDDGLQVSFNDNGTTYVLTFITVVLGILLIIVSLFFVAIFILRKRRMGQPFSHARLTENVEITNPMYCGDADEPPAFIHDNNDKGHFANPVYESMYAGSNNEMTTLGNGANTAPDEKKGLLQQDDINQQDLL
uniref:CSON015005 protein n=1 Tax=Culicoides sonorensis TaxID=179676 RepID=A0A336MF06_CULSO